MNHIELTPSHIMEYLFCPRFTYFEHVLAIPQYEEKNYKVMRGRELHDRKLEENKAYLRQRIGVQEKYLDQYLSSGWLRGRVDEVLQLKDGTYAPLDYKFAVWKDRVYDTYKTQLFCYAWLIEEAFGGEVCRGFLVYTRSRHRVVEVPIGEKDKKAVRKAADGIFKVIDKNFYPRATSSKKRCLSCTYQNVCTK